MVLCLTWEVMCTTYRFGGFGKNSQNMNNDLFYLVDLEIGGGYLKISRFCVLPETQSPLTGNCSRTELANL